MPFRLIGDAEGAPLRFALRPGVNVVGSAAECDVRLDHPTISRRHAELHVGDDAIEIVDLESRNGTFREGRRLTRERASAGDRLGFGRVELELQQVSAEDIDVAVALQPETGRAGGADRPGLVHPTVGVAALETFATDHLPALVRRLGEGAGEGEMAQAGGAALFTALPALAIEVVSGASTAEGVLFEARREGASDPAGLVVCGDDSLRVRAAFAHANTARLFRPLVEATCGLIRLATRAKPPTSPTASLPPPPDPATVVPAVQRLYAEAARVATGSVGVLIEGESGTGKEVLARYIHAASSRAKGPFVALNCAALPRDLLESELFGIERGVATGVDARPGKFELADGGSLFLDEVGDMALDTQARILRVLQEKEVYRLGGTAPRRAAVRVIAATNQDMERLLREGRFRQDLYYRIATWVARLPPLRERRADIPNLAAYFLRREAERRGIRVKGVSRAALDVLLACPWPGNIRQLEQEVSRAVLFLGDGELLDSGRLSASLRGQRGAEPSSLAAMLEAAEREAIERALREHEGDVQAAAEALGLGRSTLYRRLKALGVDVEGS